MFSVFHELLPWQTLVCELPGKQEVLFPDVPAAHFVVLNLGHHLLLWKLYIAQLQDKESWVRGQMHTNYTKKPMVYQNDCDSFQTYEQCPVSTHPCQLLSHLSFWMLLFRWVGSGFHHYDFWTTADTGILLSIICLGHELLREECLWPTITPKLEFQSSNGHKRWGLQGMTSHEGDPSWWK